MQLASVGKVYTETEVRNFKRKMFVEGWIASFLGAELSLSILKKARDEAMKRVPIGGAAPSKKVGGKA